MGRLFIGAISGTSVDGLDLALLEDGAVPRIISGHTEPLPNELRRVLLELGQPEPVDAQRGPEPVTDRLDRLGFADTMLGAFIGRSVLAFLETQGLTPDRITAVGSHGQTVRHRPTASARFTLQIGDPNVIAELTGITTVADFRRRDMAAGGQGAPLVPPFHAALFRSPDESRAILNIGGIANITLLPADADTPVRGFDTGPGNGLMDAWIARHRKLPFDADGQWSSTGTVNETLLDLLCADPYFSVPPPRSTGREYFNLSWLERHLSDVPTDPADVQATLRALTARSVSTALASWCEPPGRIIVCGGGRLNAALMSELAARLPCSVTTTDALGADGDSLEAAAFAWLAARRLDGRPGNEPAVTGASGRRVLGAVYPP